MEKLQVDVIFGPNDRFLGILEFLIGAGDFLAWSQISSMISPIRGYFPRRIFPFAQTRISLDPFPPNTPRLE